PPVRAHGCDSHASPRRRPAPLAHRRLRPRPPGESERRPLERVRLLRVVPPRRVRRQGRRLRRVHPRARRPRDHLARVRIVDAVRTACLSRAVPHNHGGSHLSTPESAPPPAAPPPPAPAVAPNTGPLGQERGVGFAIVLTLVTLGIYGIYWLYKCFSEV